MIKEIEETVTSKHESLTKDIASLRDDLFKYFATKDFVESKIAEAKF